MTFSYAEALDEVGGLSTPSKMPCKSWSTPAKRCITGSVLAKREGTICSKCYARKGMYILPTVEAAMERRFKRLKAALNSITSRWRFLEAFDVILAERLRRTERAIAKTGRPGKDDGRFFRWHDSGDLHGVEHLAILNRIAGRSPDVRFWLPTKEAGTVRSFLEAGHGLAANLTVRLSVPRFDAVAPDAYLRIGALANGAISFAAAHSVEPPAGFERCSAPENAGHCGPCRRCWTPKAISYHVH